MREDQVIFKALAFRFWKLCFGDRNLERMPILNPVCPQSGCGSMGVVPGFCGPERVVAERVASSAQASPCLTDVKQAFLEAAFLFCPDAINPCIRRNVFPVDSNFGIQRNPRGPIQVAPM
jgi:hypothetical protein